MYKLIAGTPADLRGLVQITLAKELSKQGDYFSLVRQYEEIMPIDTINVFNEAVNAINRAERGQTAETFGFETSVLSNELLLRSYQVPVTLFERDEQSLRSAISSIGSPSKRAAVRLNLLIAVLSPKSKIPTPRKQSA
jgi:hypothetical protein